VRTPRPAAAGTGTRHGACEAQAAEARAAARRQALGVAWPRARAALHGAASAPPLWARGVEAQRGVERRWRLIAAALLEVRRRRVKALAARAALTQS